jgi:hypothetical protein
MVCPCFIEDYVGFCTSSDVSYVPSIDEMERFCFTGGYCSCMLFKNKELKSASSKGHVRRGRIHQEMSSGNYIIGSRLHRNPVTTG